MFSQVEKLFFDMAFLGIDAFEYSTLVRIGEMHERRETLAQAHGVDDGQRGLAGRYRRHQSEHVGACRRQRLVPVVRPVLEHDRDVVGEMGRQRKRGLLRSIPFKIRQVEHRLEQLVDIDVDFADGRYE